ncbi:MAG: homocysteine S-methyltransferase family protein [Nitrospirae bacterium]|nr:homocysteine S-methyltransferase family protein [Nitrospirota bacterium]
MQNLLQRLKHEVLLLDGSMGVMLQNRGLPPGYAPDLWNIERPDIVLEVHREYIKAGSDIILTNTFGSTRLRLSEYGAENRLREINQEAVRIARKAAGDRAFVAGDIGPCGVTVHPLGELSFDDAVDIFSRQVEALASAGCDLIVIETMFDLIEVRAAVVAAKMSAKGLPIAALMTFTQDGRTDTGTDPETAATVLDGLGVDIIGVNCSTGPAEMVGVVKKMAQTTNSFICAQPNAGLPTNVGGKTVFPASAEEIASYAEQFAEAGVNILGGCCGTTPDYIKLLSQKVKGKRPVPKTVSEGLKITSRAKTVYIGRGFPFLKIGEKINPTGRKAFAEAIREGRMDMVVAEARGQNEAGAMALDVNVGVPMTDESGNMGRAVESVQTIVDIPLVIDSSSVEAIERGLKVYAGKALVNSVNAEPERMEKLFPGIKKYGAAVIVLLAGNEIPEKAIDRLKIAEDILKQAMSYGIRKEDLIFDCLALTVSAAQEASAQTLETIRLIKEKLGCPTILGVSNVSFGLPNRKIIHNTFMGMAIGYGLDAAIVNPYDADMHNVVIAASLFAGRDTGCRRYIAFYEINPPKSPFRKGGLLPPFSTGGEGGLSTGEAEKKKKVTREEKSTSEKIFDAIVEGDRDGIMMLVKEGLEEGIDPRDIFLNIMTPAIRHLGDLFAERKKFIPHLVASAEAMKRGVDVLTPFIEKRGAVEKKGTIIMATVRGDIHDLGKNICCMMLKNFGFEVIDLGKNVPCEDILHAAKVHDADIIGLSALMTTTMMQMKVVRDAVREQGLPCKIIIGGAVTTKRFADEIGVDGYSKDVGDVVHVTEELLRK